MENCGCGNYFKYVFLNRKIYNEPILTFLYLLQLPTRWLETLLYSLIVNK